jgi:TRAP-type C4-dicarboxylate transport system permease small subunit
MNGLLDVFERVLERAENFVMNVGAASVFLMAILITLDVSGRFFLSTPLQGTHEVVEFYLMPITIYFTIAHVERKDANIRVTLLYDQLRTVHKRVLEVGYRLPMVFILLFLIQKTTLRAIELLREGQSVYGLELPLGYSWVIVPIGFALLAVRMAFDGIKIATGEKEVYTGGEH